MVSCQLIVCTRDDDNKRAWDEGDLQSFGFIFMPGEIKLIHNDLHDMSMIYLKHLKPDENVHLPRTKDSSTFAIFVK